MAELFRYAAFISYSSKDAVFARRLHRALESYGIPGSLGNFDIIGGGKKNRIYPVFRDREELSAGHLGDQIEANLKASAALIVVCSPNSAVSPWVQKEIEFFATLRRDKIFAIISDTAPFVDETGADCTHACFPAAFRGDALQGDPLEPLAADARKGRDGFGAAWLKIVAGLINVNAGALANRDAKRRRTRRAQIAGAACVAALVAALAAASLDAFLWRTDLYQHAEAASREGRPAEKETLALGANVAPFAILAWREEGADRLLREIGVGRIVDELGPSQEIGANEDWLVVKRTKHDALIYYNLQTQAKHALDAETSLPVILDRDRLAIARYVQGFKLEVDVYDLNNNAKRELGPLGPLLQFSLAGGRAVIQRDNSRRTVAIYDFNTGTELELGPFGPVKRWSQGVDWLAIQRDDAKKTVVVYDLKRGTKRELAPLGAVREFVQEGDWLAVGRDDAKSTVVVYDLKTGTERDLGPLLDWSLEGDRLAIHRADVQNTASMYDLKTGNKLELGRLESGWSLQGERLAMRPYGSHRTVAVYDLKSTAKLEFDALGPPRYFYLGKKWLVVQRGDSQQTTAVYGLKSKTMLELGRLDQSPDGLLLEGDRMAIQRDNSQSTVVVYDLARPVNVKASGGALVASVCAANGSALWPFQASIREPEMFTPGAKEKPKPEEVKTYRILQGRPWNPCDWRGLLAVFPDKGDGNSWFEGARQWLRLMAVRHFRAKDYACAESTFGTAEDWNGASAMRRRAAREYMCDLYGPRRKDKPK